MNNIIENMKNAKCHCRQNCQIHSDMAVVKVSLTLPDTQRPILGLYLAANFPLGFIVQVIHLIFMAAVIKLANSLLLEMGDRSLNCRKLEKMMMQ